MKKTTKMKTLSLEKLAQSWNIDYQTFKIKVALINTLKKYCATHNISQRKLAKLVPGLTQDRISKIFSGQVGHMTIDKLIFILSILKVKASISIQKAA